MTANINVTERNTLPVLYNINSSTVISPQHQDYLYIAIYIYIRYMSQETLRNPWIHCVGNPQFFHGIVEDIRGIVKGCLRNRRRVSVEWLKGVRGIVKGCPWNR